MWGRGRRGRRAGQGTSLGSAALGIPASQSSKGQQPLGIFMAQGLFIVSGREVRFGGMQSRQAVNG